jgi:hypothetical protein
MQNFFNIYAAFHSFFLPVQAYFIDCLFLFINLFFVYRNGILFSEERFFLFI